MDGPWLVTIKTWLKMAYYFLFNTKNTVFINKIHNLLYNTSDTTIIHTCLLFVVGVYTMHCTLYQLFCSYTVSYNSMYTIINYGI